MLFDSERPDQIITNINTHARTLLSALLQPVGICQIGVFWCDRTGPWVSRRLWRLPAFLDNRHLKVTRLSALRTDCLYPPGDIPGTHFCWRLSRPQGHSAARRITSMKNPIFQGQAAWPWKMGSIGCPETSVRNYHSTLCKIPKDRRPRSITLLHCKPWRKRSMQIKTLKIKITSRYM
jgi:hypothetical protein